MNIMYNSQLITDTDTVLCNLRAIKRELPVSTRLIPVLKCDAYGLGLARIAQALNAAQEVDSFAVANVGEGLQLREAGIDKDILVMSCAAGFQLRAAAQAKLILTAGRPGFIGELDALKIPARVALKIDTGMHRIGFEPGEQLAGLIAELENASNITVSSTFSHFKSDDAGECARQHTLFMQGVGQLKSAGVDPGFLHIGRSSTTELYPEYNMDAVRIGRRLYMDNPDRPLGNIREAVSWRSFVTAVYNRRAGDNISYSGFVLEHDAQIAVIGVGYGDGLDKRLVQRHAPVLINGRECRLLGCSMDQSMAEVTGLAVQPGDEVTFFGSDGRGNSLSCQWLAGLVGGDEGCGLSSALGVRVHREYI